MSISSDGSATACAGDTQAACLSRASCPTSASASALANLLRPGRLHREARAYTTPDRPADPFAEPRRQPRGARGNFRTLVHRGDGPAEPSDRHRRSNPIVSPGFRVSSEHQDGPRPSEEPEMLASLRHSRSFLRAALLAGMALCVPPLSAPELAYADRGRVGQVVIDAGHGGDDLGAVGRLGVLEKDVALS